YRLPGLPLSGDSEWLSRPVERERFPLEVSAVQAEGGWRRACGRVRVTVFEPAGGRRGGDDVAVTGSLRLPHKPTNPGQFDYARLLRRRGIDAVLSATGRMVTVERRRASARPVRLAEQARRALLGVLRRSLAHSPRTQALLGAVLLGEREELDDEVEEAFKRSGTAHLLAISGLHVGVVACTVWWVTALVGLRRRAAAGVVLVTVVVYALVTGMTPSVLRATIMTVALVGALAGRRQLDPLHATALAALVLLALRPFDLFQAGFQLSFVAVVSILCVCRELQVALRPVPKLEQRLMVLELAPWHQRARLYLQRKAVPAAAVSLAAWLGVMPLIARYFGVFSPVTVLANLVAVPLLAIVVMMGFLHLVLAAVSWWLGAVPGLLAQGASVALTEVVAGAARLPGAWSYVPRPGLGWVVAYYALGLTVVSRRRLGLTGRQAAALWMGGLVVWLAATAIAPRPEGFEVTALDVRHGNATVLRYPDGSVVVCDCGCYGRTDVGRQIAAPALWHWGARRIDLLVISHADVDHINGIPSLLERFPVGRVVYSAALPRMEAGRQLLALLDARDIPHGPARAGQRIVVGRGNVLDVLHPVAWTLDAYADNQNENSLVVAARHQGRRILVPGDIQTVASTVLLRRGADLRADVLMVPHHGCAMANAPALAQAVRPAVAVCSNRAEHLAAATVAAYQNAGARVLATCWHGAVTVRLRGGELSVVPYREAGRAK
ncbi:MAG: DNA internalization-related competence protein ComEC/Rec2, partial [bacterium]